MSQQFELTRTDKKKWIENQIDFLKPLILVCAALYFVPLIGKLSQVGHIVTLTDFIPSAETVTALVFYLVNAIYDLVRKWAEEK
jgi:hypothetical protein